MVRKHLSIVLLFQPQRTDIRKRGGDERMTYADVEQFHIVGMFGSDMWALGDSVLRDIRRYSICFLT